MLLPGYNLDQASKTAEELRKHLAEQRYAHDTGVTASFGVAVAEHGESCESLLRRADELLYLAKAGGKPCGIRPYRLDQGARQDTVMPRMLGQTCRSTRIGLPPCQFSIAFRIERSISCAKAVPVLRANIYWAAFSAPYLLGRGIAASRCANMAVSSSLLSR